MSWDVKLLGGYSPTGSSLPKAFFPPSGAANSGTSARNALVSTYSVGPKGVTVHSTLPAAYVGAALLENAYKYQVAKRVVRSLRRNAKFTELSHEFDLGEISRDEFREMASVFAAEARAINYDTLLRECEILLDLTGDSSLEPDELSAMLDVDPMQLELALQHRENTATHPERGIART